MNTAATSRSNTPVLLTGPRQQKCLTMPVKPEESEKPRQHIISMQEHLASLRLQCHLQRRRHDRRLTYGFGNVVVVLLRDVIASLVDLCNRSKPHDAVCPPPVGAQQLCGLGLVLDVVAVHVRGVVRDTHAIAEEGCKHPGACQSETRYALQQCVQLLLREVAGQTLQQPQRRQLAIVACGHEVGLPAVAAAEVGAHGGPPSQGLRLHAPLGEDGVLRLQHLRKVDLEDLLASQPFEPIRSSVQPSPDDDELQVGSSFGLGADLVVDPPSPGRQEVDPEVLGPGCLVPKLRHGVLGGEDLC
mmetsp:Transcript_66011/g.204472  ORF Transcript_66011/g.204472 Transcript_66011/m.204472 type:complete len:301 (+) Transcript_66011:44-946(+)